MESEYLAYGDWTYALRYARTFEYNGEPYPGPAGKVIKDIEVVYDVFTITYEDGSKLKMAVEGR